MSSETAHTCHCQTTQRTAALVVQGLESELPDFSTISESMADLYVKEMSLLTFRIAKDAAFASAAALRGFVETQWPEACDQIHATWLDHGRPLATQFDKLSNAQPIREWSGAEETPLRSILEERRIETWFQPIFRGKALELWGYECLARARDASGNVISPAQLIEWAQRENLLFMFDRVCREKHIENAATVTGATNLNFLINFLPTVIYEPSVCLSTTFAAARRSGLPPEQIIFEVVETENISDRETLRRILDEYRSAGFRVALDDLGSGHAGLTLLADLSPDLIKIDRELIARSVDSPIHRSICKSIVDIARESNKLVLAEGVETPEEYALFRELQVDLFQGYLFGRPSVTAARASQVPSLTAIHQAVS